MKKFFLYPVMLCLSICLTACSSGAADGETSELENSQNPVTTEGLQDSPEPSGQETDAEAEPSASTEEPSSDAGETEESEFDTLPRWTFAEITEAKAGDIVTFGTYEQDNDAENGAEPIEWFILDMEDGQATLLSVYLLDCQRYHPEETDMTWEDCAMRAWLNDDFLNAAFTKAEQEHIAVTKLVNEDNPVFGTQGGNDTSDKIWLLSLGDVEKYFHISVEEGKNPYIKDNQVLDGYLYGIYCYDQDHRVLAKPTAYAIQQLCYPFDVDEWVAQAEQWGPVDEEFRAETEKYRYANGCGDWWLRSPGHYERWALSVTRHGSVSFGGIFVSAKQGVRPALTVTY